MEWKHGVVGRTLRAVGGSAGGAAGQALALVWIAKTSTSETLGQYALALALVGPLFLFARMQLRYLLAAQSEADFGAYLRARAIATGSCLAIVIAGAAATLSSETALVVALVGSSRALEDLGDLLYGERQRIDDWNGIAASQALRGLGGAAALAGGMSFGESLAAGLTANLLWQAAVTLGLDARGLTLPAAAWRDALPCLRTCWPLGAAAALVSLHGNLPRYALEWTAGSEEVGHYAALAQLALIGNLPVQALGVAALAGLGRRAQIGRRAFRRMILQLAAAATTIAAAGLLAVEYAGREAMTLLYTPEIAAVSPLLIWVMAGAGFTFLTAVFGYGMVALGEKGLQMRVFALSAGAGAAACYALVPGNGLEGAVMANLVCWSSAAILSGGALYLRALELRDEGADCPPSRQSSTLDACSAPVGSSYPSAP